MASIGIFIGTIGLDLTLKCITAVTASAQSIYTLASSISSNKQEPSISKLLQELDIVADIQAIELIIKDFNIKKHHTRPLSSCLESLEKCVKEIETQLYEIQVRLCYNKTLWTSLWAYKFTDVIENLKSLKIVLDNRKTMLFEVIKINGYLETKNEEPIKLETLLNVSVLEDELLV